ncbi:MAG: hypothetical protein ABSC05_31335 [Candidatus Solibacter sp.]|jgi:hypothetical protein
MVKRSFTAVLERNRRFAGDFETEPYETAWASEARWFVRILDMRGTGTIFEAEPEISPDGLFWCPEGNKGIVTNGPGLYSFALRDFGHWVRLSGKVSGENASVTVIIYLALKE